MALIPLLRKGAGAGRLIQIGQTALDPRFTFTRASNGTAFNSAGVNTTYGNNVQRWDYRPDTLAWRGLQMEGARTNQARNATFTGGTAGIIGSGGVLPTFYALDSTGGLTTNFIGTGTELGFTFAEFEISGTSSGTEWILATQGTGGSTPAGTPFVASARLRDISGKASVTGTSIQARDIGGAFAFTNLAIDGSGSIPAFQQVSRTSGASATDPQIRYRVVFNTATSITYRFRIYTPQLEANTTFATSFIPTSGAAATRVTDAATAPITSFGLASASTFSFQLNLERVGNGLNMGMLSFDDGTGNNTITLRSDSTTATSLVLDVFNGGVLQGTSPVLTGLGSGAVRKIAGRIQANNITITATGNGLVNNTTVTLPAFNTMRLANGLTAGTSNGSAWLSYLETANTAWSNAELTARVA